MNITEDRISNIAHKIIDKLWRDDLVDFPDETKARERVKSSIASFFKISDELDDIVRKKLASYSKAKVPGSREWEILYSKFYEEEAAKRKL